MTPAADIALTNGEARRNLFWIDPNKVYSPPQIAGLLGLDRATVQKWCRDGELPACRNGERGHYRINGADALRRMLAKEAFRELECEKTCWYDEPRTAWILHCNLPTLYELVERGRRDQSLGIRPNTATRDAPFETYLAGVRYEETGVRMFYGAEILRFWSRLSQICCE